MTSASERFDADIAGRLERLGEHGVYVTAFSFPVVPEGQDRIRTQMSAALTRDMLDRAIGAFEVVGREMEVIR